MQTMVLLGAGASAEAEVPTAVHMTEKAVGYLRLKAKDEVWYGYCAQLLTNLIGALIHAKATCGQNPIGCRIDIEELVATVRALLGRKRSRFAPFADWRRIIDLHDMPYFQGTIHQVSPDGRSTVQLLAHLREAVRGEAWGTNSDEAFALAHEFASHVAYLADPVRWENHLLDWCLLFLQEYLDSVLWVEPSVVTYLHPLVSLAREQGNLVIATLNYDTSIEAACCNSIDCDTQIMTWYRNREFPVDGPGVTLLKLHGSVDWGWNCTWFPESMVMRDGVCPRQKPDSIERSHVVPSLMIFGSDEKLRPDGPFLDLLFAFKRALQAADRLLIVGYSFRDEHINAPIRDWFNRSNAHRVIVIDPSFPEASTDDPLSLREEFAKFERSTERNVRIIRSKAGAGLAMLAEGGFSAG